MGYIPVQRDAGRIMYESAMQRAGTIGGAVSGLFQALNQQQQQAQAAAEAKAEEARQFNAKLKAVEALMQTHKDKFKLNDEQLKQFLTSDPAESPKDRYLRLGGFIEGSMKAAELEKTQAETKKLTTPPPQAGQLMTLEDFRKIPSDVDASAEPIPGRPGMVMVTKLNLRAPASQKLTPIDLGGEMAFVDDKGQVIRREPKTPQIPAGYEYVGNASTVPAVATQTAAPASAMAARAEQPIAGPAILGRFMPPSTAPSVPKEALEAMQSVGAPKAETVTRALRPTPGGPVAREEEAKLQAEQASRTKKIESLSQIGGTIDSILSRVNEKSVGPAAVIRKAPVVGKGTDAAEIESLLPQLRAQLAFDALKDLKASNTSLGQVAIKEIELLQSAIVALDQDAMKPETFRSQLMKLKDQINKTSQRLIVLDEELRAGRTEPSERYYKLGGRSLDDLSRASAAPSSVDDPMKALEAAGFKRTKK
jgi:hypothetical protein